ncbi:MAG: hypothetical protein JSV56_02890 [Methanomassiliicoccales archaeon]|nr:MAG: hypothetical protein JSV56_02890 [Methanomassiliicoccales archaeon]
MEKRRRKFKSLMIVTLFVMSALAVMVSVPAALGNETLTVTQGSAAAIEALYEDDWMEDDLLVSDGEEPIVFNCDYWTVGNAYDSMYYLGDIGRDVDIELENGNNGGTNLVGVTATLATVSSTPANPITVVDQSVSWGPWADDANQWCRYTIDIGNTAVVEHAYPMRLTVTYTLGGNPGTQTLDFEIWISSVWDSDTTDAQRDLHLGLPNLGEPLPDDFPFESGSNFQEGRLTLTDHANEFNPDDVWGNITAEPTDIYITADTFNSYDDGNFGGFLAYRVDVPSTALPGPKTGGSVQFDYTRDDTFKRIREETRAFGAYVDFTPRLTASLVNPVEINQNDLQATLSVVFTNTGNVALVDLIITPDLDTQWLDATFHHYENDDDVYETSIKFDSLAANTATSAQTVVIAANMMLPNGSHRVPFAWNAWYYADGSTGANSQWSMEGGEMYNHDAATDPNGRTPELERLYKDNDFDRKYSGGDTVLESDWTGCYVDFQVNDDNGMTWEGYITSTIEAGQDNLPADDCKMRYKKITITLYNYEMVDYKDIVATLETGPASPFFDPADHAATSLDMDPTSQKKIQAFNPTTGVPGTATVDFTVDINAAWWEDNAFTPETYIVDVTVDATNNHDETRVEGTVIPVKVDIDGFGPELFASIVSTTKITPGKTFTLTITITNFGDDIAREVDAYLRADFVSGWTILDQFTTSIGGYGGEGTPTGTGVGDASWGWETDWGDYNKFNRSHDIRPDEVGVDNVPQIVELYDWIKRRETAPQGKILWIHLDRLEPGTSHEFVFEMVSDVNMVEGMVYYEVLELYFVDSNGETWGPDGLPYGNLQQHYSPPQEVLIRAGKGEKYQGQMDWAVLLWAIIFLVIAFIVFLIGYALGGKGGMGGKKKKEPEPASFEDYESEPYAPPEPEPEPEMPGPPPGGEEDIGPPLPEDKPPE